MAEGDVTNNDAADANAGGGAIDAIEEGGAAEQPASGSEAAGGDPAGFEPSGVGAPANEGGGEGGEGSRPGDWNPGEQSGGGGELY